MVFIKVLGLTLDLDVKIQLESPESSALGAFFMVFVLS